MECRLLHHDPWRILDLLQRRVAGSNVAGHALCSAAYSTLSVIGSSSSALLARARDHAVLMGLAVATAGHCMDILTNVSLLLPAAISQILVAECNGELDLPAPGPIWLITVLEGVHQLETACGKYSAAVAGIKLVESLIKCIGLTDELLTIAMQVISGMGCYHTQWQRKDSSQSWDMTAAVFSVLHGALGCSSLQGCHDAHTTNRDRLMHSLLHDGLLIRLFWVRSITPDCAHYFGCHPVMFLICSRLRSHVLLRCRPTFQSLMLHDKQLNYSLRSLTSRHMLLGCVCSV